MICIPFRFIGAFSERGCPLLLGVSMAPMAEKVRDSR